MICTQTANLAAQSGRILLASDLPDTQAAAQEISDWLHSHRYRLAAQTRPLLVYENGVCVRHWVQAEPQPFAPTAADSLTPVWGRGSLFAFLSRQTEKPKSPTF